MNSWELTGTATVENGNGVYKRYSQDRLIIRELGNIVNGFRDGAWHLFYEFSASKETASTYVNGIEEGIQTNYFEDGGVQLSGMMSNEKRTGKWKWYFETGELETEVSFVDGKKNGIQTFWDEAGIKTKEEVYENGVFISENVLR